MKWLVYSDVQATDGHERCHGDATVSLQIARVDSFYQLLLQIYETHKCDALIDLGDTTDDRSAIPVPAIDTLCSNLAQFPHNDWNLKLIGNHEQYLRNTEVHVGKMFAPYFTVVEGNEAFSLPGKNLRILACSYPADQRDTIAWLSDQRKLVKQTHEKIILLGHFQVMGSITGAGQLLAGIPKEDVTWVDLGLLGHVHKPQAIHKNVHYIGSPFQQDWGEAGEEKRVGIVDVFNGTVEWVPIEGFPLYRHVTVDQFEQLCTSETEDRFKVVLKSPKEATKFYALPLAHRGEPIYEFSVTENLDSKKAGGKLNGQAWSFDNVVQRYVEHNTPKSKGIPATVEEMVSYGHDIAMK